MRPEIEFLRIYCDTSTLPNNIKSKKELEALRQLSRSRIVSLFGSHIVGSEVEKTKNATQRDHLIGDCKALTTYMKGLLKASGISSFQVLVRAGEPDILDVNFPYDSFNHVILMVPQQTDTIWLECTSQMDPCGYMGTFTENHTGLLLDGEHSHLVHIPALNGTQNRKRTTSRLDRDAHHRLDASPRFSVKSASRFSLRDEIDQASAASALATRS